MTRRQVLRRLAVLLGGAVSGPVAAAVLSNSRPGVKRATSGPRTLSVEQDRLVSAIAELILPATDTPGAKAAGVNEFIDLLLTDWLADDERERFLTGLADVEVRSREKFERPFLQLTAEQQVALLEPLDQAAVQARLSVTAAELGDVEELPFFGMMKEMTLVGYYTSEIGMRQELKYMENPGSYAGCVPLAEVGRTWA